MRALAVLNGDDCCTSSASHSDVYMNLERLSGQSANVALVVLAVVAPMNACDGHHVVKLSRDHGYLSSHVALGTGCGLESSPWQLMVSAAHLSWHLPIAD